jgi:hypothetical protein
VDYQAGWRIGVQWILMERDGGGNATRSTPFPAGPGPGDPGCAGDQLALACQERHYLAFEMPPAAKGAPAAGAPLLAVALLGLACGRMRRGHA